MILNEGNSLLLDQLAKDLDSAVFNVSKKITVGNQLANGIYNSLNRHLFNNDLDIIPIAYMSYIDICGLLKKRDPECHMPDKHMLGMYSVMIEDDFDKITKDSILDLHDDIIVMNLDMLSQKSLIFNIASICHEMIHYYDRCFGEWQEMIKMECILKKHIDAHETATFKRLMRLANSYSLKVIPHMYTKNPDEIDYDTAVRMMSAMYDEQIDEQENEMLSTDYSKTHVSHIGFGKWVVNMID